MIRMLRGAIKMKRAFKKILAIKGATMTIRLKNEIRNNLTMISVVSQNQQEEKARNLILKFFRETTQIFDLAAILRTFYRRMVMIQLGYKKRKTSMVNRA